MASIESQKLIELFESIKQKEIMVDDFKTGKSSQGFDSPMPTDEIKGLLKIETTQVDGFNLFRLSPQTGGVEKEVLYLHGGGYVNTFSKYHWQFLAKLAVQMNCAVTTPDYPLAPQFPYPKALNMVTTIYKQMLTRCDPRHIFFMGDSAGGGLCLALAQKIRDEKVALPRELVLLSPFLDVTMSNPAIDDIEPTDPFLSVEACKLAGEAYAGENDPKHPWVSPLYGEFHDLPRITIFMGSRDILAADARKMVSMLAAQKREHLYDEFEGMFHVWMLFNVPEAQKVIDKILTLTQ